MIGHISCNSHRKYGKLYRGSQEAEKKRRPGVKPIKIVLFLLHYTAAKSSWLI